MKKSKEAPRLGIDGAQTRPPQPVIAFACATEFSQWLDKHHADHPGIWMKIFKKDSGLPTVTYAEALDVALCYGWIDGQKQSGDAVSWLQKFTRRRPRSEWSRINVGHVERLTREQRMKTAGLAAVDGAKADGRWERAYPSARAAEVPDDLMQALAKSPQAKAFFDSLNQSNRYAIFYRLHSAKKPETRTKRLREFLAMLKRGEKLH